MDKNIVITRAAQLLSYSVAQQRWRSILISGQLLQGSFPKQVLFSNPKRIPSGSNNKQNSMFLNIMKLKQVRLRLLFVGSAYTYISQKTNQW